MRRIHPHQYSFHSSFIYSDVRIALTNWNRYHDQREIITLLWKVACGDGMLCLEMGAGCWDLMSGKVKYPISLIKYHGCKNSSEIHYNKIDNLCFAQHVFLSTNRSCGFIFYLKHSSFLILHTFTNVSRHTFPFGNPKMYENGLPSLIPSPSIIHILWHSHNGDKQDRGYD